MLELEAEQTFWYSVAGLLVVRASATSSESAGFTTFYKDSLVIDLFVFSFSCE